MEAAIQTVVKVFLKSAKGSDSMGGKDFDNLVKKQLGNVLTDTDSKTALKEMRKGLDENQDGKVSFEEYMTLIGYLATSMSDAKTKEKAEAPKGDAAPVTNSAPAQENNSAAPAPAVALVVEPPKLEEGKKVEVALPESVAAAASAAGGAASAAVGAAAGAASAAAGAVSAAATSAAAGAASALSSVAAAAGVVVEEAEPKESADGALAAAASLAEGEVKVEAPTS